MAKQSVCWLQITSGRGPEECALFVGKLSRVILESARSSVLRAEVLDRQPAQKRECYLSVLLKIDGHAAEEFAAKWQGTHQWICQSPFRPNHKRKNWFIGVDGLVVPQIGGGRLDPAEVEFTSLRASGPGGQHVNATDSAVRAMHRSSGLTVLAREERSQHMNKKLALARLAEKLAVEAREKQDSARKDQWSRHNELERGNPVRVFKGLGFKPRIL